MARAGDTASIPVPSEAVVDVAPPPGARLGRYELLTRVARGGMAEVWLARQRGDLGFSRLVAVKTIRPEVARDPLFRKMFLDEARIASRIRHANVAEVVDLGEEGATVFLAMGYVEGGSLRELEIAHRRAHPDEPFPLPIALRIVADVASGLHAAHELREDDGTHLEVVHRDVSPQNVLVGFDGVAKLCDFGIAKALGRVAEETEAGQLKGKFSYLSPEQVDRRPLDRRSDLFAAGIVLWELCTGRRLFQGDDVVATVAATLRCHVPDPQTLAPHVPDAVSAVVMRALSRDRERRFATGEELALAIERAARETGMLASARDVAAFVSALMKNEASSRREGARRAAEHLSQAGRVAPAIEGSRPADVTATGHTLAMRSSRTPQRVGAILFVAAAGAGAYALVRAESPTRTDEGPAIHGASLAALPPTSSPATSLPVPPVTSSLAAVPPRPSTSAASSIVPAASTPSPRASQRPRLPRFGSPYGK